MNLPDNKSIEGMAPFSHAGDATINNLVVGGEIVSGIHSAGVVGFVDDNAINAFRAYFELNGLTAGDPTNGINSFALNFGNEESGIFSIENGKMKVDNDAGAWYTIDGRILNSKPTRKGIYINNGQKVVIK